MPDMKQDIGKQASAVQADSIGTINNYGTTPAPVNGIPKNLTLLPAKNPNFVGRKNELQQIKDDLASDSMVYIVNGIGGIGKSELAYKYLLENEEKYQHIALFEFSETSDTLEDIFIKALKQSLFFENDITLDQILYRLQNLPEKCLLVFDNLKNSDDIEKLKPLNNNCDVLITTRLIISNQKTLNLDILPLEDSRTLFQQHYSTDENIDDILEYIDYHSLFIELIAKTLQEDCLSLQEIREKFQNGEFAKIDRDFESSFNDFLIQRFQIEDNDQLKNLLQLLALLPSIEIQTTTLEEIFDDKKLKPKLSELAKRGWLIKKAGSYKLHQIIKEFILANHAVDFEATNPIIKNICRYHPTDNFLNLIENTHFIKIIESIISRCSKEKNKQFASITDLLSMLYFVLGRYDKALKLQQVALSIRKDILRTNHLDTAISYNNIGLIYEEQENHPEALRYLKKALIIRKNSPEDTKLALASTYSHLGSTYNYSNNNIALDYNKKALDIRERELGKKHHDTATIYHNLALTYEYQKNNQQALIFYKKALNIYTNKLGNKHRFTATTYANIGNVYESQNDNQEAVKLYQKSLNIRKMILGYNHPDLASSHSQLARISLKQKKCNKALGHASKAHSIYKSLNIPLKTSKTDALIKEIKHNIKKARKLPLKRRARICKDKTL